MRSFCCLSIHILIIAGAFISFVRILKIVCLTFQCSDSFLCRNQPDSLVFFD
jgi:hypothetical protein